MKERDAAKAFLICGSTGAGKSTLSAALAKEQNAQVFSIDEWMQRLYWKDAPAENVFPWAMERVLRCEDLIYLLATRLLDSGVNVIFDLAFSRKERRELYFSRLADAGYEFDFIFLDIPAAQRLERVRERNAKRTGTFQFEVNDQMFHWMETQFEPPTDEEILRVGGVVRKA